MNDVMLSIVLPCYNEEGNIPLILSRFREVLKGRHKIEVLLVDNGSTDDSKDIFAVELLKPENDFARLVTIEKNRGYGFGIMQGVFAAQADIIAWTHADMQTDPQDVVNLYDKYGDKLSDGKAYAKGRRIRRNFFDSFFTWGMSKLSSLALGMELDDVNGQPKMFHRSILGYLNDAPDDFSLDLFLMYQAAKNGIKMYTLPVCFADRKHGQAKGGGTLFGKWKLIVRTYRYIMKTKKDLR
jgi:glycosyltransferase involved in cell wall biosynthesis